jgi:hypothetical protein
MKNVIGILRGIAMNLCIAIGSVALFKLLILLISEQGRSFHLLVTSPISSKFYNLNFRGISLIMFIHMFLIF